MPIYRNLLDLEKSGHLHSFFDAMHPFVVFDRMKAVDDYLHDAEIAATCVGGPDIPVYYFHDNLRILETLQACLREMVANPIHPEIIRLDDGTLIGTGAFYDMLDDFGSLEDAVDDLDELARVLSLFLYAGNVREYKQCRDTVEQLTILMRGIFVDMLRK